MPQLLLGLHLIHLLLWMLRAQLNFSQGLKPGIGVFIQEQFANFGVLLGEMNDCLGNPLQLLLKYTTGNGHALALTIAQGPFPLDAQNFHPNTAIGEVPGVWNGHIDQYQHINILWAVIFYK
ncbi:hypothetical protein DFH94DRAFT_824156 [Russula ochroleuca]|uniref:Uncharacterized protein n=1 Tax=Russula ochroleuca TaxID=152965 RepID=A0A9P5N0B4_9AGAM|nr:hypothetical protein DFH94DRAFT_824156 [Russula ochroleuca]